MALLLFNPENDLALGLGCRNYTAPPHAAALHRAGALFPMWWAEPDDLILAPAALSREAEELSRRFGLHGRVAAGDCGGVSRCEPWGWSADARRQFERAGVSQSVLPADDELASIRRLSHRRISIEILRRLGERNLPVETSDPDEVVAIERLSPGCFIKSPWSGSGRGVFCAAGLDERKLREKASGIIHRQGSVMVEHGLDRRLDFAALFFSRDGKVGFRGLSIFKAEARGMYSGNIAAPQEQLRAILSRYINIGVLDEIIRRLEPILTELVGRSYEGWMGVDMMVHSDGGECRIMPCVELNLRMTMGVAAMKICGRLGLTSPHYLAWQHGSVATDRHVCKSPADQPSSPAAAGIELLPPSDGFRLTLSPADASVID